jgi:hypothetical protein
VAVWHSNDAGVEKICVASDPFVLLLVVFDHSESTIVSGNLLEGAPVFKVSWGKDLMAKLTVRSELVAVAQTPALDAKVL